MGASIEEMTPIKVMARMSVVPVAVVNSRAHHCTPVVKEVSKLKEAFQAWLAQGISESTERH